MQIESAATPPPVEPGVSRPIGSSQVGSSQMGAIKNAKLADGAQQFEAMMLQQMLKPLQFGAAPGDADTDAGANDTIRTLGTEAIGKAIAKAGGFGLAKQIVRQVTDENRRNVARQHSPKV
jgi:flagellar protein FlgJ